MAATFIMSGFFVSYAHADVVDPPAALGVTQITAVQTFAQADGTFADGWKWVFDVTVPNNQTLLKMEFADWTNGSNIIPAGSNIQFYSAQSLNASSEASAIGITASSTYSGIMVLDPNVDLDVNQGGRQIQITVEARVPVGSAGGSYSTSYGINTTATSSITFGSTMQTYNGTPEAVNITTNPLNLTTTAVTYAGTTGTNYISTTTPPTHAGIYTVYAQVTDPNYTGTSTAILTISPAPVSALANPETKIYDGATTTDPALTYTVTPPLYSGDSFTGTLARDPGEDVGSYNITQGTLKLDSDYILTYTPNSFVITPASVKAITLGDLSQTYDKTGKSVSTTTNPAGLSVNITYNGLSALPVNAGTYSVIATIADGQDYEGSTTGSLVINPVSLTVTATSDTKGYDGTVSSAGIPTITSGALATGDSATWTQTFATKDVGTNINLIPSAGTVSDGNGGNNYVVKFDDNPTGIITPATATVSAKGVDKVYDGTTTATVTLNATGVGTDVLTATGIATFENKNVGNTIPMNVTGITISGPGVTANDYTYSTTISTTANITPAPLTITANNGSKTYGDTLTFAGTEFTTMGLLDHDSITSVTLTSDGAAGTASVSGSPYSIVPSAAVGTGLSNYTIAYDPGNLTLNPIALTATLTAGDMVYNGDTKDANGVSCSFNGVVNNDPVNCTPAFVHFDNKNVGTDKLVTSDQIIMMDSDGKYILATSTATTTADIIALPITITAVTDSKTYDGTASSTKIPTISSGALATGDSTTSLNQVFDSKNVGSRTLTPSIAINDGNGGANYNITSFTAVGTITAKDLNVTATGVSKQYDGSASATVTLSDNSVVGDSLTDSYTSAAFTDPNVGTGKLINVSGIKVTGTGIGNYNLTDTATTTTANITPAPLTITANNANKTYGNQMIFNGTTGFTFSPQSLYNNDEITSVTLTSAGAASTSSVSGLPYSIVPSAATGTAGLTSNYTINYVNGLLTVAQKPVTGTITASNKTYDGTNIIASTSCSLIGIITGDNIFCTISHAKFSSRNAGTSTVSATLALAGTADGDYILSNNTATTSATINPLAITVTAVTNTKVYDGTTAAAAIPTVAPSVISPDIAQFIETYDTASVKGSGSGKTLTPSGSVSDGNYGDNYTYTFETNTTGTITQASQTITVSQIPTGPISGDTITLTAAVGDSGRSVYLTGGTSGVCSADGNDMVITIEGIGTCSVTANLDGTVDYSTAPADVITFTVEYSLQNSAQSLSQDSVQMNALVAPASNQDQTGTYTIVQSQ